MAVLSTRTDPIILDVSLDWRVLTFTTIMVLVTTVAFAVLPAVRASRGAQFQICGARTTGSRERTITREVLLGMQVAMSVVLVSAALLFVLTVHNLSRLDLGFARNDLLVANVFLLDEDYPPPARAAAMRDLTQRFEAIPGISGVAHSGTPPFVGASWGIVARCAGSGRRDQGRGAPESGVRRLLRRDGDTTDRRDAISRPRTRPVHRKSQSSTKPSPASSSATAIPSASDSRRARTSTRSSAWPGIRSSTPCAKISVRSPTRRRPRWPNPP